jgi:quercetin dioxygenase-like cupin family protein
MLSVVDIAPGSVSPVHSHPNEQGGVCLEGEWVH